MSPSPSDSIAAAEQGCSDEYFVLNVSGTKFETTFKTLTSVGSSRLAELARRRKKDSSYRGQQGDYFFDRHSGAFESVLHFHRTGKLHVNSGICGGLLKQVLISVCAAFTTASIATVVVESQCPLGPSAPGPAASLTALSNYSLSHPDSADAVESLDSRGYVSPPAFYCRHVYALYGADFSIFLYFVLELAGRLAVSPNRRTFLTSLRSVLDAACCLGHALRIVARYLPDSGGGGGHAAAYDAFREGVEWLGVLQLLRLFRLLSHSVMAQVLMYTVLTSVHELAVVLIFVASFVVGFACLAHYAEEDTFPTILYACWWAFITLTTVGYGDVYPKSVTGCVVGCMCALGGIFILAFTVPVVVSNFNLYYNHVTARKQWREKCERANLAKSVWKELPLIQKLSVRSANA